MYKSMNKIKLRLRQLVVKDNNKVQRNSPLMQAVENNGYFNTTIMSQIFGHRPLSSVNER